MATIQDLPKVQIRKQATTRFQGAQPGHIDKTFLSTASAGLDARAKAEAKMRADQLDFVKTMADNDAENDVIGASAELAQHQGLNSLDKSISLRQKLQNQFDKRKEKIPEQFHPYIDQVFAKKMTRFNKFAIPYTLGQVTKVKEEADKTYLANSMNEAIEDSGDTQTFNAQSLGQVSYAAMKAAQRKFGDQPELIQEAVQHQVSETIRRSVEQQAFLGRFDNAQQLINNHNHEMTPSDRVKAIKLMDQARSDLGDKEASDLVTQAEAQFPDDPVKQELWMRSAARNDKILRSATAFQSMRSRVKKDGEQRQLEKVDAEINQALLRGENPTQLFFKLPPGEERDKRIKRFNENRGQAAFPTDFNAVDRLSRRLSDAVSSRELPDDLIDSYRHLISPQDIKPLEQMFFRLKQQDNKDVARVHRLSDKLVHDEFENWAKMNGVRGKDRGMAFLAMQDEVERLLAINSKPTSQELKSTIRNTLRSRGVKETRTERLWGLLPDKVEREVNPNLAPDGSPQVHPSWYDAIRKQDSSLTPTQINAVINDLVKNGKDVSKPRM